MASSVPLVKSLIHHMIPLTPMIHVKLKQSMKTLAGCGCEGYGLPAIYNLQVLLWLFCEMNENIRMTKSPTTFS